MKPNVSSMLKQAGAKVAVGPTAEVDIGPPIEPPAPADLRVNILIVDDEPRNLTVLETVLDDPGYRLVRAGSGDEALLALMADEFAVLVLDVRMPDMNGFELAQLIKNRKKTARVPIIFLTAFYNEDQHILAGYDSGAVDYLHKPINAVVLRSKVAVFAALYRASRALNSANSSLRTEVAERRRAETELRELNETLDQRVIERTDALRERERLLKRLEAQLRDADRRKDEFLATLAHELRNPLAPVRNAVQVLQIKGKATPEMQWAHDMIERQVRAMSRLIDDLMDVARIRLGRIEMRREPVELATVLHEAVASSRPLIDESGHVLVIALPDQPLVLDADPTRLVQVFMNLLTNAAKYMNQGGRIELSARQVGNEVEVTVKDAGIGLAANQLTSVFEMFSQAENGLPRSQGGLGIGLSLAKRLVELHGGRIEARSSGLGQGSAFVVRLPVPIGRPLDSNATAAYPAGPIAPATPMVRVRVLVVDDNLDGAVSLAALLSTNGHEVHTAHDGEEAVRAAGEWRPQVVLLDLGLPKLNGFEACCKIRQQPWGQAMTIVAVTGWGDEEAQARSREAGFNQHLVKPVDPALLLAVLAERPIEGLAGLP
jgi:signal transduction histidine kinase